MAKKHTNYYLDNATLVKLMCDWKERRKTDPKAKISDDLAKAFLEIIDNLARSGRFCQYTWLQEMKSDAIWYLVKFSLNFDPEKSKNAFSYLTQIVWNAFIARIKLEKEHLAMLQEYRENINTMYDISDESESDEDYNYIEHKAKSINSIFSKEKKEKHKKAYIPRANKYSLNSLMDDDNPLSDEE